MSHDDHPHLPHGSWVPFFLAISMALLGLGLVLFGGALKATADAVGKFHFDQLSLAAYVPLVIGLVALVASLVAWFVQDHAWWKTNTGTGLSIPKAGGLLFISSEVFLFGALFANYFSFQQLAHEAGESFVPHDLHLPLLATGFFTIFLFASSWTLHKSESFLKAGNHKQFVRWWGLTIILGLVFLGGQVMEYVNLIHEGHTLGSSQFITAFYILTGTHGLHVFAGLVMLTVIWIRAAKGQFNEKRHAGPEIIGIYWHFVDLVWVFVFGIIYVLNAVHL